MIDCATDAKSGKPNKGLDEIYKNAHVIMIHCTTFKDAVTIIDCSSDPTNFDFSYKNKSSIYARNY